VTQDQDQSVKFISQSFDDLPSTFVMLWQLKSVDQVDEVAGLLAD
jgi:hypothetical protein